MLKWVRRALSVFLFAVGFGAFVQWPFKVPSDLDALHDLAIDADVWLLNHFEFPALLTLFLMIGVLLLFPDLMRAVNALRGLPRLNVTGLHLQRDDTTNHYRMIVTNEGGSPAENVKVLLWHIEPRPRFQPWTADYPYPVQRIGAPGSEHAPCQIGPGLQERFEVISGWPNDEGMMFAGGLDTKSEHWNPIHIEDDERWALIYEVTADNATSKHFALTARIEGKVLLVERTEPTVSIPRLRRKG